MFQAFDDEAMRAIGFARSEARRCKATHIGTPHLLVGAMRVLSDEEFSSALPPLGEVLSGVRALEFRRRAPHPFCDMWFTEAAIAVLQRMSASRDAGAPVGPNHLIDALAGYPECRAYRMLEEAGVDFGRLADLLASQGAAWNASSGRWAVLPTRHPIDASDSIAVVDRVRFGPT